MNKISATIITLNEEKLLTKCLESVVSFCNEIIVVDSGSHDNTVNIAKKYGAKVYIRKFDNYASQKNFAAEKATGDWIFSIDGDESVEPELAKEIRRAVQTDDYEAYSIPRKNIILGRFIKYTRWQPELDRHVWLYKKVKSKWVGEVHEEVVVKGKVGSMKHAKIHNHYENVGDFLTMMNNYSSIEAVKLNKNGNTYSPFSLLYPVYHFLVRYIYRLGFLDGWRGFVLSYLMAIYHLQVAVKVWELQKK